MAPFWMILISLVSFICETRQTGTRLKNFCYFTNWSNKLASVEARFDIKDINATLCTHLIYAFAKINTDRLRLERSESDDDNGSLYAPAGRYFDINTLKQKHPHLKTLLSIGGATAGSDAFKTIVATENSMREFSRNSIIFMRDRDFDGIDIDWEWPRNTNNKEEFTQLLQIMREEFDEEAARKNKETLLLTVAVGVGEDVINASYNIPEISRSADYLNVMAYDFHGTWSKVTSFSGPLYSRTNNIQFNQKLSQAWAIQRWIDGGAPPGKLIMGMTAAATTFTLYNLTSIFRGVGARAERPGKAGPYMQHEGHVTYYRICEILEGGAVEHWDNDQRMAYTSVDDQWYGFGTPRSMKEKVEFAYNKELGGTMFWSMDLDDFKGDYCTKGPYPLLTAIYDAIDSGDPTKTTPRTGPTTTPGIRADLLAENQALQADNAALKAELDRCSVTNAELAETNANLERENNNLSGQLREANNALKDANNELRAEMEQRLRENDEELENVRKSSQRTIDALQRTLVEVETRYKTEITCTRIKKKYETDIRELEAALDNANRANVEYLKQIEILQQRIRELEDALDNANRASAEEHNRSRFFNKETSP